MPAISFDNLRACLDLVETEPGRYDAANLDMDYRRVFGGQILAQTLLAATAAAGDGKEVKSLAQLFPREGQSDSSMRYAVTKHQEGRTYASSGVVATQVDETQSDESRREKTVSVATVSLHTPEDGSLRQDDAPDIGKPEAATAADLGMIPWETRAVDGVDLAARDVGPASYRFWMRTPSLPDSPPLHQALLAYATDLTIIGTALRPAEGLSQADSMVRFHSAVTSHSLWFHQALRVDEWLLVDQCSPVVAGSRAYGRGDVWSLDGRLVASFAQESMIRMLA
ncbi:MAG: acyl-CoA thioesterase [Frankiaceae bacterium]|nr:acyl-CoA thioesterase [Frankiaceae bacterium]